MFQFQQSPFFLSTHKNCLVPTRFVLNAHLGLLNVQLLEHRTGYSSLQSVQHITVWHITLMPLYTPTMKQNCKITFKSVVCIHNIYTYIISTNIIFNVTHLHIYFWTEVSVWAFIPTLSSGQNCPFWHIHIYYISNYSLF
jgi:hypothetical protein